MALIKCPECGGSVSDTADSCPHCGYSIKKVQQEINTVDDIVEDKSTAKPQSNMLAIGIIGAIAAVIVLVVAANSGSSSSKSSYNYNSTNTGNYSYSSRSSKYSDSDMEYFEQRNADLEKNVTRVYSNSSYTICEGTLKNNGSKTYTYIKIKGSFQDKNGNVIDTDWTYAVGSEGLSSGEQTTFRLSVDKNSDITDCKLTYVSD